MTTKLEMTLEEKASVVGAARNAAVAMAAFWDALKEVEDAHGVEFDGTADYIGILAADCDNPPNGNDLDATGILDGIEELLVS